MKSATASHSPPRYHLVAALFRWLLLVGSTDLAVADSQDQHGWWTTAHWFQIYKDLPPLGKCVTGLFVGYVLARILISQVMAVLKLVLLVCIVTLVLRYMGVAEHVHLVQRLDETLTSMLHLGIMHLVDKAPLLLDEQSGIFESVEAVAKAQWMTTVGMAIGALGACVW